MDEPPYLVKCLTLAGFRAYLQPKTFDFSKKRCLAIFAPNGNGKSSVIDALEFVFSEDGTLERLGRRATNNQAGPVALAHNRASEAGIRPIVAIDFVKGGTVNSGERQASGNARPIPPIVATVNGCFTVRPIIRGYSLRTFVESESPEQRYEAVARWLQLGPLVVVQKNIRNLRKETKAAAADTREIEHIKMQFARETSGVPGDYHDEAVIAHINDSLLAPLDEQLAMRTLDFDDLSYVVLTARVRVEEDAVGLAGLRQVKQALTALWSQSRNEGSDEVSVGGGISAFEAAVAAHSKVAAVEALERCKAANAVFETLWKAAEPIFAEEGAPGPTECPICATPVGQTTLGSVEGIRVRLASHLNELADYSRAKKVFADAEMRAAKARMQLYAALQSLPGLLGREYTETAGQVQAYQIAVNDWVDGEAPPSGKLVETLRELHGVFDKAIAEIEAKQGDRTYGRAKSQIERLVELRSRRVLALRRQDELLKLSEALDTQASTIASEIRKKVQALLNALQIPMNDIYKMIQGASAMPIRLELPHEDETH